MLIYSLCVTRVKMKKIEILFLKIEPDLHIHVPTRFLW